MASPSYTYSFSNGSTADASQVNQNFSDILNGVVDGTKDLSISALTCAGTATFNGNVTLGNASSDDVTVTGSLASSIPIKTNNSYNIGSATLGLAKIYLGNGGAGATCDIISASHATTREYTIPDCGAAASFVMTQLAQTIAGVKTFSSAATFSAGFSVPTVSYRGSNSGTQTVATGATPTQVDFGATVYDPASLVSNPTTAWTFTAPIAGKYQVSVHGRFTIAGAWSGTEELAWWLYKNGSYHTNITYGMPHSATTIASQGGTYTISLAATDTLSLYLYQTSGGDLTIDNTDTGNLWVQITFVST